jgi:hypothetical protein
MSGFEALTAPGAIMVLQPTILRPERQRVEGDETGHARSVRRRPARRYCIILRIKHANLDPDEISAALGRQPDISWKSGDQCTTDKGRQLLGTRTDGLWSLTFRYRGEKSIGRSIDQILDDLMRHKELFSQLDRIGAKSALYLQLPGDTNIGDQIPSRILQKFVDLGIDLELEIFPEWT